MALLLALLLAIPAFAGSGHGRAAPQAVIESLSAHLDNLSLLSNLPPRGLGLDTSIKGSITGLSTPDLQSLYIDGIKGPPADQAARILFKGTLRRPRFAARLGPVIEHAHPEGKTASENLKRWASGLVGDAGTDDPENAEKAWARLAAVFDGEKSAAAAQAKPAAQAPDPLNPGPVPSSHLSARPHTPLPSAQNMRVWFETHPVESSVNWVFSGIEPRISEEILEAIQAPEGFRLFVRWLLEGGAASVMAARTLGWQYSEEVKRFWHARLEQKEGMFLESYANLPELISSYRRSGVGGPALRHVLDRTLQHAGGYRIVHDAQTWQGLTALQRAEVLKNLDNGNIPPRRGHALMLRIDTSEDLAALAHKYAAGRDPRFIEDYLRRKLKGNASVTIPLESILPRFIRRNLHRFEDCTGPDCLRAAVSVREGYNPSRLDDGNSLIKRLYSPLYSPVEGGRPEPGDVFIYAKPDGTFVHAATYVGDGYVFTKNGMSRYNPYLFQSQAETEAIYFPSGKFQLLIFRPTRVEAR